MVASSCTVCGAIHSPDAGCPVTVDTRLGALIANKYELTRLIGCGGMGKVYEARHRQLGRRLAIKFLLPEFAQNAHAVMRFENEARAAGSLEHENIAAVFDCGIDGDGSRFLVMEYVQGEDCQRLLARNGPLPVERAVNLALQVCRGVHAAHEAGIVHRDLKPANLLLAKRADGTDLIKILDFGIAKLQARHAPAMTAHGTAMGTAHYMSPEQARGDQSVDRRTDIYAIGAILYEFLSGAKPHVGESYLSIVYSILHEPPRPLETLRPGLPPALCAVVAAAMCPDPVNRIPSAVHLAEALTRIGAAPRMSARTEVIRLGDPREAPLARPVTNGARSLDAAGPSSLAPLHHSEVSPRPAKPARSSLWRWAIPALALALCPAAVLLVRKAQTSQGALKSTETKPSPSTNSANVQPTAEGAAQPNADPPAAAPAEPKEQPAAVVVEEPPEGATPRPDMEPASSAAGDPSPQARPRQPRAPLDTSPAGRGRDRQEPQRAITLKRAPGF